MCLLLNSSVPEQYTLVPTWSHPPVAILSPSSYIYNLKRKRDSGYTEEKCGIFNVFQVMEIISENFIIQGNA